MNSSLSLLPTLLAAAIVGTDRRIIRALRAHHALSSDSAIALSRRGVLWRWRVRRLTGRGALVAVSPDRVYLNEAGWQAYRTSRRRRVLVAVAIAIPLVVFLYWMSDRGT